MFYFQGDTVYLEWLEDGHRGSIPIEYLVQHEYSPETIDKWRQLRQPTVTTVSIT